MRFALLFMKFLYFNLMIQILNYFIYFEFFILGLQLLLTPHKCFIFYLNTYFIQFQTYFFLIKVLCIQLLSYQVFYNLYLSSLFTISIFFIVFCHLAIALNIEWQNSYFNKKRDQLRSIGFLILVPIVVIKGDTPHALTNR